MLRHEIKDERAKHGGPAHTEGTCKSCHQFYSRSWLVLVSLTFERDHRYQKILASGFPNLQHRNRTTGRPCRHGLISEYCPWRAFPRPGNGNRGRDLVPPRPGFTLGLLLGIVKKTFDP